LEITIAVEGVSIARPFISKLTMLLSTVHHVVQLDSNDDGFIDFDMFAQINVTYPMVLFPSFQLQDNLQEFTLGERE
jgi:hypothetical protein